MPDAQIIEKKSEESQTPPLSIERMQMMMASLTNPSNLSMTPEHVAEILAQRKQLNEFVHEDKKEESEHERYIFRWGLIFIFVMSVLILLTKPEYFTQVIALIIGGFGGFGFGKSQNK